MSYFENVNTRKQDTGDIDAFGRTRVSQISSQLDLKQLHDQLPLFYDTEVIGTGTAIHSTATAATTLSTAAASDAAIIQSKQFGNYQSGKSQQILMTFAGFDHDTNITKRIGYFTNRTATTPFDSNKDGLWLESDGTNFKAVVSLNGVSTSINQSNWNIDPMDGTGDSGITIDFDLTNILLIDFEWLGVGRVRFGFVVDGMIYYFHEFLNANVGTSVYMLSPNQPVRAEIRQTGAGSGNFDFICATIGSEGSINKLGKILSDNIGTAHINCNSTSNKYALLGIRLQSAKADTLVDLLDFSLLATTSDNQLVEVWLNPTVAGLFTYSNVSDSSVQIAKGLTTGGNTVTGGTLLFSQYVSSQRSTSFDIENAIRLGRQIDHTVDEIVLTTNPLSSNSDVLAAISWRELA